MNVILTQTTTTIVVWSNLKKCCEAFDWKYSTVSKKKLPIEYKGVKISRVKVR